jgi:hypothetical protein
VAAPRIGLLLLFFATLPAAAQEDFTGPFPSWTNVRTYGAMGKGIHDDSAAIQAGLDELGTPNHSSVLYFPPGTYSVGQPLILANRIAVSIVGADPQSVRIRWTGAAGASLLTVNGVANSRFSRITFDGGGKASVLVDQAWDGKGHFDTGNEYSDDVFTGAGTGIRGGNLDQGFAETAVLRSRFLSLETGIALKNFNALDLWVWDSLFDHCKFGISNHPGAGNWHVYNSKFLYSGTADNFLGNTGGFSFIGNYSTGSAPFLSATWTGNPAFITVQGNTIRPAAAATSSPIVLANQGPLILIDNRIGTGIRPAPAVLAEGQEDTDVFSIGNRFAAAVGLKVRGRLTTMDDRTKQAIAFDEPVLPATPPHVGRKVFEVKAGAAASEVQAAIDAAARLKGQRPVVHLSGGRYEGISITIPASDLQIVGDGLEATSLSGAIRLLGPASHVSLRDFSLEGTTKTGDGILITGADQPRARIYLQQVQATSSNRNLLADGLNRATIDARNFNHTLAAVASVQLKGAGEIQVFSGASFGNAISYAATGGSLLVRDVWYDSAGITFLRASGKPTVTVAGTRVATPGNAPVPTFDLDDFSGTAALIANQQDGRTVVSTSPGGSVLAAGLIGPGKQYFRSQGGGRTAFVNGKQRVRNENRGSAFLPETGTPEPTFVRAALAQMRAGVPGPVDDLPPWVTDVRLDRIGVSNFEIGIHIVP